MEGEVLFAITLQTLDAKQVVNLSALDGTSIGQKVQLMKALKPVLASGLQKKPVIWSSPYSSLKIVACIGSPTTRSETAFGYFVTSPSTSTRIVGPPPSKKSAMKCALK
jgi:hypothetical protein